MNSVLRGALVAGLGVLCLSAALACGDDETATPAPTQVATATPTSSEPTASPTTNATVPTSGNVVTIAVFAFEPATITVPVGSTVTWMNTDASPHRMAGTTAGSFSTETIAQGESAEVTFDEAGEFPYICEIHPSMAGTVIVE